MIDSNQCVLSMDYLWVVTRINQQINLWKSDSLFQETQMLDCSIKSPKSDQQSSTAPTLAHFLDHSHLIISIDQQMKIFDVQRRIFMQNTPLSSMCACFDLAVKHNLMAIGRDDRILQIKDCTQETFQDFLGHSDRITHVKFHQSNELLISIAHNEIMIWRLGTSPA